MASDKITIDRELFERLTHAAIELEGEWHWKAGVVHRGYAERFDELAALVRESVAIRDAPQQETPQRIARHPMQPVVTDEYGTARFLRNAIVEHMVDSYPGGLNELACNGFGDEDWTQLAQLIGYSVEGFGDLSYVSDEAYQAAVDAESELRKSESLPRRMTDREREAWLAAGKYEVQLLAAAQRLQAVLLRPRPVDSMDVVEAVDELIARHAKAIDEWKRINLPATGKSE